MSKRPLQCPNKSATPEEITRVRRLVRGFPTLELGWKNLASEITDISQRGEEDVAVSISAAWLRKSFAKGSKLRPAHLAAVIDALPEIEARAAAGNWGRRKTVCDQGPEDRENNLLTGHSAFADFLKKHSLYRQDGIGLFDPFEEEPAQFKVIRETAPPDYGRFAEHLAMAVRREDGIPNALLGKASPADLAAAMLFRLSDATELGPEVVRPVVAKQLFDAVRILCEQGDMTSDAEASNLLGFAYHHQPVSTDFKHYYAWRAIDKKAAASHARRYETAVALHRTVIHASAAVKPSVVRIARRYLDANVACSIRNAFQSGDYNAFDQLVDEHSGESHSARVFYFCAIGYARFQQDQRRNRFFDRALAASSSGDAYDCQYELITRAGHHLCTASRETQSALRLIEESPATLAKISPFLPGISLAKLRC